MPARRIAHWAAPRDRAVSSKNGKLQVLGYARQNKATPATAESVGASRAPPPPPCCCGAPVPDLCAAVRQIDAQMSHDERQCQLEQSRDREQCCQQSQHERDEFGRSGTPSLACAHTSQPAALNISSHVHVKSVGWVGELLLETVRPVLARVRTLCLCVWQRSRWPVSRWKSSRAL